MRGRWLVPALMLALAACGGDGPQRSEQGAAAQMEQSFHWKMVTTWPKNYPGLGTAPEKFAELIARMTKGRLTVKVYGAGQLVPAMEVFDTVSSGTAEMGHGAAYPPACGAPPLRWYAAQRWARCARTQAGVTNQTRL